MTDWADEILLEKTGIKVDADVINVSLMPESFRACMRKAKADGMREAAAIVAKVGERTKKMSGGGYNHGCFEAA